MISELKELKKLFVKLQVESLVHLYLEEGLSRIEIIEHLKSVLNRTEDGLYNQYETDILKMIYDMKIQ
ncbi:MAG: hypothetical protein WC783_04355 [Candidatus Paceibacterota bacterium]|jgi:hypothetical protein